MISLKEFLQSGDLGELRMGMSQQEVINLLGQPEDYTNPKKRQVVWKYRSLEIAFEDKLLCFIGIYIAKAKFEMPELWALDIDLLDKTLLADFTKYLASAGISFTENRALTFFDDQLCLKTQCGVDILFLKQELNYQLHSIQYRKRL